MSDGVTQQLAGFAAGLTYDAVPAGVRESTKLLILDALACAVAGNLGEETSQMQAMATALGASQEASLIGGGKLSLAGTTVMNGYLMTAVTMCDVHRPGAGYRRTLRRVRQRLSDRRYRGVRGNHAGRCRA